MRWRIVLAFLFSVSHFSQLFSQQSPASQTQALQMIPEPVVTMGTTNRVFSDTTFGQKTYLFKMLSASVWDTLASSGDPNQFFVDVGGLVDGETYQYQVLFNSELSNIVASTQDAAAPVVVIQLPETFVNTTAIPVNHAVSDVGAQGIKKSDLYYRPDHSGTLSWRIVETKNYAPAVAAVPGNPFLDAFSFAVPDSLGDGPYEFLIVSQDTAWAPEHRPDSVFVGDEGNIVAVTPGSAALKQLFVDTHEPSSQITSSLNQFTTGVAILVAYSGEDIREGHLRYSGSGITRLSLYVNYKTDPSGPYVYTDSLYQSADFSPTELQVSGAFNFVADRDGYYEFYTLASDTAQNSENGGAPKQVNLPFMIVDTSSPQVGSIAVSESVNPGDNRPPAQPGWTKTPIVDYQIIGAGDIIKDGYESGLDTIRLAEDIAFSVNDSSFSFSPQDLAGTFTVSPLAGNKQIFTTVLDAAGNASFPVSDSLIYDPNAPLLTNFDIPVFQTAENTATVSISAQDDFVLDSLFIWRNDSLVSAAELPAGDNYQADLNLDLPDLGVTYVFTAQIRDKAGNLSAVASDSVRYVEIVDLRELSLSDDFEAPDPFFAAVDGFARSTTVEVRIRYFSALRKLQVATDAAFSDVVELSPPWNVLTTSNGDTTIQLNYTFTGGDGPRQFFARGIGPQDQDTSNVVSAAITIDTQAPVVDGISVYRVIGPGDTTFAHTNARTVQVQTTTVEAQAGQMLIWETGLDSIGYNTFSPDTAYALRSPDDGQIEVNLVVRDFAGNWSAISSADVFLDRRLPRMDALSFDTPFTSTPEVNINFSASDDTLFSGVGLLDRIRFSEDSQFPPGQIQEFSLPAQVTSAGALMITLGPALTQHTVFAQVRDRAGNWSNTLDAQITLVDIVQPTALVLADRTPLAQMEEAAFPGWSNSDTVRVTVTYDGVLHRIVAAKNADFSSGKTDFDSWTVINDSTAAFDYDLGPGSGATALYVRLIGPNPSDTSAVISATINIDKAAPTLSGIEAFRVAASGDTLFEFVSGAAIRIRLQGQSEALAHARLKESLGPTNFIADFSPELGYTLIDGPDEVKTVSAAVRDSAGNWSIFYDDTTILDTSAPRVSAVVVSDASTPGTQDSTLTDDTRIEINFTAVDNAPGQLFRVLVAQSSDFSANLRVFTFAGPDLQSLGSNAFSLLYDAQTGFLIGGEIVCWVALDDSAQNRSNVGQDGIPFSEDLGLSAALFDIADPGDSLFSASNQVSLQLQAVSGIVEEIAFSESANNLNNWTRLDPGQVFTTDYTFANAESFFVGRLYVAGRNIAGQFVLDSTEITIDKVAPSFSNITIQANSPAGDTEYTNRSDVSVSIQAVDTGLLKEVHISLDSTFATFTEITVPAMTSSFSGNVDFEITTGNGKKTIYARIVDFAENQSPVNSDDIIADFDALNLVSNHPNPFNPNLESTTMVVKSDGQTAIEVRIYDLFGNLVWEVDVPAGSNYNQIEWNGQNGKNEMVANGGYVCVVKVGSEVRTRKIAVIK